MSVERIEIGSEPPVRGVLHPAGARRADGLVLTHGAGGNAEGPLLVAVAEAFVSRGVAVLRCDLPFRQARPRGAPSPAGAERDREGLRAALRVLAERVGGASFSEGTPTVAGRLRCFSPPSPRWQARSCFSPIRSIRPGGPAVFAFPTFPTFVCPRFSSAAPAIRSARPRSWRRRES